MDYDYLAQSLAALSGVPVRLYTGGAFERLYHHTRFKPDLAVTEEANIFRSPGNVSYYMDGNFLYYGLFRSARDSVALVMGPVSQVAVDRAMAVRILRAMGESVGRAEELVDYFAAIPSYPLRNFLQILCTVNFFLNGEKLDITQLLLSEEAMPAPPPAADPESEAPRTAHNTDELEAVMLSCVEHGRVDEIQALFRRPIEGRAGTMAADALRQEKNLLICATSIEDGHMEWQVRAEGSLFYTKYGNYETRATGTIDLSNRIFDVPLAHSLGIHCLNFSFNFIRPRLSFRQNTGFKFSLPVPRNRNFALPVITDDCLLPIPVPAVS